MTIARVLNNERTWHVETTDVLAGLRTMPSGSVHCAVTSPPYYALRDYGVDGQIGLEPTLDEFLAKMVEVFEEVRRVLRDDGTCWVNMGDAYAHNGACGGGSPLSNPTDGRTGDQSPKGRKDDRTAQQKTSGTLRIDGLKPKDKMLVPWRLVLMLQSAGWYVRDIIVWHKPAPMPESVNDRCTQSWEPIFLLAKRAKYYYDNDAVREAHKEPERSGTNDSCGVGFRGGSIDNGENAQWAAPREYNPMGRNLRNVWTLSPEPFAGAHFATFPTELPRRCIKAGTSEWGCCAKCGAPWKRVTEKDRKPTRPGINTKCDAKGNNDALVATVAAGRMDANIIGNRDPQRHCTITTTTGWQPTCKCNVAEVVPAIVMDIFNGSGTTGLVARRLGRRYVGLELNPEYADMARKRIYDDAPLLNAS